MITKLEVWLQPNDLYDVRLYCHGTDEEFDWRHKDNREDFVQSLSRQLHELLGPPTRHLVEWGVYEIYEWVG